jgi:hypothetical protein
VTPDDVLRRVIGVLSTAQDYLYRAQAVPVWVSADGRVTPITEMDDRWLANAIGVCERGMIVGKRSTRALPAMRAELARRRATPTPMRKPVRFADRVPSHDYRCTTSISGGGPATRTDLWRAFSYRVCDEYAGACCEALDRVLGCKAHRVRYIGGVR